MFLSVSNIIVSSDIMNIHFSTQEIVDMNKLIEKLPLYVFLRSIFHQKFLLLLNFQNLIEWNNNLNLGNYFKAL